MKLKLVVCRKCVDRDACGFRLFAKDRRQCIGRRVWWEGVITEGYLSMYEEPVLSGRRVM